MDDKIKKFAYLWDGTEPGWVLLKTPELPGGFCVYNKNTRALLHIESNEVNQELCEHIKRQGGEIVDVIPSGKVTVTP